MVQELAPRARRRRLSGHGMMLRRKRIFAGLREGLRYDEIAAQEGVTTERIRQIVAEVLKNRSVDSAADHAKLQLDRLVPALQIAVEAVASGDVRAIPSYLKVLGVGLQSHFVAGSTPGDLPAVMADFAALGVDVAVTELDLRIRLPADAKSLAAQAGDYASVVRACRATERCVGVTTWGITDDRSWIPSFFSGYGAALPFDEAYRPKPAVAAMTKAWTAPRP